MISLSMPKSSNDFEVHLSPEVRVHIAESIDQAQGQEVFFVGTCNEEHEVTQVRPVARGNEHAVPLILSEAEKGDLVLHNHPSGNLSPATRTFRSPPIWGTWESDLLSATTAEAGGTPWLSRCWRIP